MQNDPELLFVSVCPILANDQPEMARILSYVTRASSSERRSYPQWQTTLAPRIILGLWHPLFLQSAYTHLPLAQRYHIGFSIGISRKFFWDACQGFSIAFPLLVGAQGQAFLQDCRDAGKEVCVWTVNNTEEMKVAISWGVKAVLTDKVGAFARLKQEVRHLHPRADYRSSKTRTNSR